MADYTKLNIAVATFEADVDKLGDLQTALSTATAAAAAASEALATANGDLTSHLTQIVTDKQAIDAELAALSG